MLVASPRNQNHPRGFAPRTSLHAVSLAPSAARSDRVTRSLRSLASLGPRGPRRGAAGESRHRGGRGRRSRVGGEDYSLGWSAASTGRALMSVRGDVALPAHTPL